MDRQKQKTEAVKRMKMLRLLDNVIEEFEEKGIVELSEYMGPMFPAALYWTSNDTYPGLDEKIKEFEEKFNALVYHVQLSHLTFGDCYSFFYVSEDEEEWEFDRQLLKEGYPLVYVWNATDPWCSEFGSIGIQSAMGGVARVE